MIGIAGLVSGRRFFCCCDCNLDVDLDLGLVLETNLEEEDGTAIA